MSIARHARLLEATAPDAFASVLPEIDRCDRLSTAWDDMAEALSARDYNAFDGAKVQFAQFTRKPRPLSKRAARRLRHKLFDAQGGLCAYCGEPMVNKGRGPRLCTLDHVTAIANGGANDESNIVAACHQCNRLKGCMTPAQMRALAERIDVARGEG